MTDLLPSGGDQPESDRELLRGLVDKLPQMLAYWDADQRCRFANRAYEHWFGVKPEAIVGMQLSALLGPLYALNRPYIEAALRGEPQEFERDIPDPAGGPPRSSVAHYLPDVVDGKVRGFGVLVTDVTQRKRAEQAIRELERQVHATDRLVGMATLAAGIAHEINNPLAVVLGNVELSLRQLEAGTVDPESTHAVLVEIQESALRMRDIVQSIKLLARGDTTKREPVEIERAVEQSISLTSNVLRYRARITKSFDGVGFVQANASQLVQVFVNLLVNASEACSRSRPSETRFGSRRAAKASRSSSSSPTTAAVSPKSSRRVSSSRSSRPKTWVAGSGSGWPSAARSSPPSAAPSR